MITPKFMRYYYRGSNSYPTLPWRTTTTTRNRITNQIMALIIIIPRQSMMCWPPWESNIYNRYWVNYSRPLPLLSSTTTKMQRPPPARRRGKISFLRPRSKHPICYIHQIYGIMQYCNIVTKIWHGVPRTKIT